jgi:hypothetical protein
MAWPAAFTMKSLTVILRSPAAFAVARNSRSWSTRQVALR